MSKSGSASSFVLGALCGAVLGVLFAPRPGYESREILVDRALDYWDNADGFYDAASDRAVEIYATSRDVALDASEQVRTKIEAARAKLLDEVEAVTDKATAEKASIEAAGESAVKAVEDAAEKAKGTVAAVAGKAAADKKVIAEKVEKVADKAAAEKEKIEAKIPEAVEVDVIVEEKPVKVASRRPAASKGNA